MKVVVYKRSERLLLLTSAVFAANKERSATKTFAWSWDIRTVGWINRLRRTGSERRREGTVTLRAYGVCGCLATQAKPSQDGVHRARYFAQTGFAQRVNGAIVVDRGQTYNYGKHFDDEIACVSAHTKYYIAYDS